MNKYNNNNIMHGWLTRSEICCLLEFEKFSSPVSKNYKVLWKTEHMYVITTTRTIKCNTYPVNISSVRAHFGEKSES